MAQRVKHCHCCGSGYCCEKGSIPALGTSVCHRAAKKKKKKIPTPLFPTLYGLSISVSNIHVSSRLPPPLENEKCLVLFNSNSKKIPKLFNYSDDYWRTSGSLFSPWFMAGKNRWSGKGIKEESDFLVQGITAYYNSKHSSHLSLSKPSLVGSFGSQRHDVGRAWPRLCSHTPSWKHLKAELSFASFPAGLFLAEGRCGLLGGVPLMPSFWGYFCLTLTGVCNSSHSYWMTLVFDLKNRLSVQLSTRTPRGRKMSSSCSVSTEYQEGTGIEFLYAFLKFHSWEEHWAPEDLHSNSRKDTFTHGTLGNSLDISGHWCLWRSHRIYMPWSSRRGAVVNESN